MDNGYMKKIMKEWKNYLWMNKLKDEKMKKLIKEWKNEQTNARMNRLQNEWIN